MTNAAQNLADLDATTLAALIAGKEISPVEAVTAALERLEATRDLNAFMAICNERALREARDAEAAIMRGEALGPLCGVPFSAKDLIDTEGVVTTYGSAFMPITYLSKTQFLLHELAPPGPFSSARRQHPSSATSLSPKAHFWPHSQPVQ